MDRRIRISLSAFIAISIFGLAALVFVRYRTNNIDRQGEAAHKPGVKIEKIHYSGTKDGRVQWELTADSALRTNGQFELENVTALFYAKDGSSYTLTARQGRLSEEAGEITASGDVLVAGQDGSTLRTDALAYRIKEKSLSTAAPVRLKSRGIEVTGEGMTAEIEPGTMKIMKNVKAVIE